MEMAKKACPDVPASGQAVREDALQGNASRIQFNTADGGGQGSIAIADYLAARNIKCERTNTTSNDGYAFYRIYFFTIKSPKSL